MPDWDSLTNSMSPKGSYDVGEALKKCVKANTIRYNKKEDGDIKSLAGEIWEVAEEDPIRVIEAFNATIQNHKNIKFLFGCLRNTRSGQIINNTKEDDKPVTHTAVEEVISDTEGQDGRQGKNYILLYREIRRHPYFINKPKIIRLIFIDFLLDASYIDHNKEFISNNASITVPLKRGQWITSYRRLAAEYEVHEATIRRWLKDMIINEMIAVNVVNMKDYFNDARSDARSDARCDARHENLGIVVTICNYNKWQPNGNMKNGFNDARSDARSDARCDAHPNKGITKEGITNENTPLPPKKSKIEIKPGEIFEIWEKERGVLNTVTSINRDKIFPLVEYLNGLIGNKSPQERWIEIIHKARQCHKEHYSYMTPYFFSKDLEHVDQVMNGLYDKSFTRGRNNAKTIERHGIGNAEDFGIKGDRTRRLLKLGSVAKTEVPEV